MAHPGDYLRLHVCFRPPVFFLRLMATAKYHGDIFLISWTIYWDILWTMDEYGVFF